MSYELFFRREYIPPEKEGVTRLNGDEQRPIDQDFDRELSWILIREELFEKRLCDLKEAAYNFFISTGTKSVTLTFNPYTKETSMEDPIAVTRIKRFRRKRK